MCPTDNEYVQRCKNGDKNAFRNLVNRHQKALMAVLIARMGNYNIAEEAAQEAFVRAYFSLGKLRSGKLFFPWLVGIAIRAGKELIRHNKSNKININSLDLPAPMSMESDMREESLLKALEKLTPPYRETILLRFYANLSCAEISQRLGTPVGSVTKRLSRGYELLRDMMPEFNTKSQDSEVKP